jgi:hypothetical protein
MVQGDPDCELITDEIDWARLVKIILLELQARRPLPNDDGYWAKKGFDLKKRPMSLTLKMLHNFIEVVTEFQENRYESVTQSRVDKSRVEYIDTSTKDRFVCPTIAEVNSYCLERENSVNPQKFVDFYTAKGWMIGKNKVKDWKACVRTWEIKEGGKNNATKYVDIDKL